MTQTKRKSFIESLANTLVGLIVTIVFSPLIYWVCDVKISLPKMNVVALLFTILSVIRNYVIRRWFNKIK